jgi:hypothetical protein
MIAIMVALAVQTIASDEVRSAPVRTPTDPCIELMGRGRAMIGNETFRGRALSRAVAERVPTGRPLFLRFANAGAENDVQGMATVMAAAQGASEIVIVETCEISAQEAAQ